MANLNDTNSIQSIPVTLCLRWNLTWIALGIVVVVSLFPCDANANANSSKHRGADVGRESAANVEAKFDENDPLREDQQGDSEEIWLVSSRHVKCPSGKLEGLRYYRRSDNDWVTRSEKEFYASAKIPKLNVVFVHGNRTDFTWASRRGLQAHQNFVASQNPGVPTRYIIWSWPSDQAGGPVSDFRIKAQRASREGQLFGAFLAKMPNENRVSLMGYSYGSRIVLGGLQSLSGGSLLGERLSLPEAYEPPPLRVTLIAAATSSDSLNPQSTYGNAYPMMDRLLLLNNTADRALKLYKFLDRQRRISPMGRGIAGRSLLEDEGERVEQFDFAKTIGHKHGLSGYFCSPKIRRLLKQQLFWMDDDGAITETVDSRSASR